jgi:molecular chaperone GrpE
MDRLQHEAAGCRRAAFGEQGEATPLALGDLEALALGLLEAADDIERALRMLAGTLEPSAQEGLEAIVRALLGRLDELGFAIEDPCGEPFDPHRHEAIAVEPGAPGLVMSVQRRGLVAAGRLLRAAAVTVGGEGAPTQATPERRRRGPRRPPARRAEGGEE